MRCVQALGKLFAFRQTLGRHLLPTMSRMTPAQIIAIGEYLETDFDPSKLTVSQLLGVLSYHNIAYPTPYSKTKLVQLFNEELKPRSAKYKKERTKRASSVASDDGITDGLTGQPLNATRKVSSGLILFDLGSSNAKLRSASPEAFFKTLIAHSKRTRGPYDPYGETRSMS